MCNKTDLKDQRLYFAVKQHLIQDRIYRLKTTPPPPPPPPPDPRVLIALFEEKKFFTCFQYQNVVDYIISNQLQCLHN